MATSNYLRRMRRFEATNPVVVKKEKTEETFGEKSKRAWSLVKNGEAKNIKEAWAIIKKQ